jgi:hypothetical protein
VDISDLDIGSSIKVNDIVVDADVELMADPGQAVCMVALPKEEVEEVETDELLEEGIEGGLATSGEETGDVGEEENE